MDMSRIHFHSLSSARVVSVGPGTCAVCVCVCLCVCMYALKERASMSASVEGVCLGMCVCVFARLFSHINSSSCRIV